MSAMKSSAASSPGHLEACPSTTLETCVYVKEQLDGKVPRINPYSSGRSAEIFSLTSGIFKTRK